MFITKHLGYKIDSDSKHISIRAFGYEATKIERNMIMEKKYFANLEYREVNGVFIPDIELPEDAIIASSPSAVPGNVHHRSQCLSDTHHGTFTADDITDLCGHLIIKHRSHTDGLRKTGSHSPLSTVESLSMLNG